MGKGRCSIVDTWWQTETGGVMLTPLPRDRDAKPGAAMRPFFGVEPVVLDANGNEIHGNGIEGVLAIRQTPPSMARTIYGHHQRYCETYLKPYPGYYYTGDAVRRDEDGHIWCVSADDYGSFLLYVFPLCTPALCFHCSEGGHVR